MSGAGGDPVDRAEVRFPLVTIARRHGKQDVGWLAAATVANALKTFTSFADVFLIGLGIDALFNDEPLAVPLVPDAWVPTDPIPLLVFITVLLVALNLLTNALSLLDDWGSGLFSQRFVHRTRAETFSRVQHLEISFFEGERTGNLLSILNDDINQLDSFFSGQVGAVVWIATTLASALVYMWVLNPQLALLVLLSTPMIAWMNHRFSDRLEPLQAAVRERRGALNAILETALSNSQVIKANTAEQFEQERVEDSSRDDVEARLAAVRESVRHPPLNRLVMGMWLLVVASLGIYWVVIGAPGPFTGTLTAGQLVPFLFYLERLTLPMQYLGGVISGYNSSKASANRVLGVTADAESDADAAESADISVTDGSVRFDRVRYRYPDRDRPAIDDLSFAVEGGETIGIVGPSGAGKSTLIDFLLKFRSPTDGEITIDGQSLADVSAESLRGHVGYVSQEPHVFDGTVAQNIEYGDSDASDAEIRRAARLAGADEFIEDLPDGYDTLIGDRGSSLSGGQRQRLAVARSLVADPPILILDEAASQVDPETERRLQENLHRITESRTTFVVAHRLSMVRDADTVVVLDEGQLVERGTHGDLLADEGLYAEMWNVQIGAVTAV